jgi:tropomodulin
MSRVVHIGTKYDPKNDPLADLDIDELVERLTPGEIQRLLDECDPDDPNIPPSLRSGYKCEKQSTGPLNKQKLLDFINEQAMNTPDLPEAVPFVQGTVRGKKWQAPPRQEQPKLEEEIELDIDLGDETEVALNSATTDQIVDLAGILGLHSMMNQDQFHSAQSDKWASKADPEIGWNGITKATPLKVYPAEEPNRTDPEKVISQLRDSDNGLEKVNLNNIPLTDEKLIEIFEAMRHNDVLMDLSMANCMMGDFAACNLACALENNKALERINIESNNVSPHTLIKIFEVSGNLNQS